MNDTADSKAPKTPITVAGMYDSVTAGIQGTPPKSAYEVNKVTGNPMGVKQFEKK